MHPGLADVDWEQEGADAVALLQGLLRHDTTNPPGDEAACAAYLGDWFHAAGLEPRLLEPAPRRANLVTRLPGGDEPPLLLSAHLDVVQADPERWRHPPFGGEIHDGFVWGRGAIDMKHMAAMSAVVARLLLRSGVPLRRDVIFAGVADEEAGCGLGSAWLVDNHPDEVRAGFALSEVGGFTLQVGRRLVYPVQVAEKGICWIRARARGTSGHGSVPREDNPVVALSRFVDRVAATRLRPRPSPAVERFVRELAATQPRAVRAVLPLILRPQAAGLVERLIRDPSVRRTLQAILRNTACPTVVQAGNKTNVIPGEATAELDGRIAVGSTADELLAELEALAGDGIELEVLRSHPPTSAPVNTPLFTTIADVVAEHHPGAVAVPNVIPGFTDAAYWSQLGMTCYGFSPVRLDTAADAVAFADLFHADDERIPVDGFQSGLRMLADVVFRFCAP